MVVVALLWDLRVPVKFMKVRGCRSTWLLVLTPISEGGGGRGKPVIFKKDAGRKVCNSGSGTETKHDERSNLLLLSLALQVVLILFFIIASTITMSTTSYHY